MHVWIVKEATRRGCTLAQVVRDSILREMESDIARGRRVPASPEVEAILARIPKADLDS